MSLLIYYKAVHSIVIASEKLSAEQIGSNAFITGPGRYRKVEEKSRKKTVKFAGRNSATLKSYDQITKYVKDK